MQSCKVSYPSASRTSLCRVRLQSAAALTRCLGAQSSSDTVTSRGGSCPLGRSNSASSTCAPMRRLISSAVSSAGSPLKFPQCPSWPPGSGRIVSKTSKCPGQRLSVIRTPSGRCTVRLLAFMPRRPGSMCSPSPSYRAVISPSASKAEGKSARTSCPSQVVAPLVGSTTSACPRRKPPPTASALMTAGLFSGPPGPYRAWMWTHALRTTQ
mmetsp:Transcript_4670/g.13613  ORF Transcript_4670/g.13613 Transcript_4670/m.13613 type:complete len:211 (+) Transcript_4670:935-1567(+)